MEFVQLGIILCREKNANMEIRFNINSDPVKVRVLHMKHHATVQHVRERYNNLPQQFLKDFFTTVVVPFTHVLNRGMMLHIS